MKRLIRKSSIVILAILVLNIGGFVFAAGSEADSEKASLPFNSKSSTGIEKDSQTLDTNYSSELYRIIVAILIVVLLGVAAVYTSKKLLPKWSAAQGKKIKVIESIHLGTRKTVHLLEIGNQQILIGTTHDRITKLADIFSEKGFPLNQTDKSEDT